MKTAFVLSVLVACGTLATAVEPKAPPSISVTANLWKDCSIPQAHGKINNIVVSPNPPARNAELNITANITIDETVTDGEVKISLSYNHIPLYHNTFSLCDLLKEIGGECPVKKKQFLILTVAAQKIPDNAPSGQYTGNAVATDQNQEQLFCIDFDMKLN